jgi:hypothetical protein
MRQQTRKRRFALVFVSGLLFYIAEGAYFHNVIESVIGGCITMLSIFWMIPIFQKIAVKTERKLKLDRDEGLKPPVKRST